MNHANDQENFSFLGLTLLFQIFIATVILYPSHNANANNVNYVNLVLPNIMMVLTMGWYLLFCPQRNQADRTTRRFAIGCTAVLILYNVACYISNGLLSQWYWDQINYTVGILFFLFLILCVSQSEIRQMKLFRFMMIVTAVSTLCCLFMFHGYGLQSLNLRWLAVSRNEQNLVLGIRCSWLYPHKSQYALVLLMSIFLVLRHRKAFARRWMFWGMLFLLCYTLYICDTMSAFGAAAIGVAGLFFDYLRKKGFRFNRYTIAGLGVLILLGCGILFLISRQRRLDTLGARIPIWTVSIQNILKYPAGVGIRFGAGFGMQATETLYVDNCHNVFLNHALRYSIPAGILFTLLILLIALYTIRVKPSFFAVGSWTGILILLNMDQALITIQFPYFILLIYFIYLYDPCVPPRPAGGT